MQEDEVEESVEFESNLAEVGGADESKSLEEAKRCDIIRIDAGDHGVLAENFRALGDGFEELGADALAAGFGMDVNGAFHGEPVAGPGAEVAKAGEACDAVTFGATSTG